MKCLYAEQMRRADQDTIGLGIPGLLLMENAGRSVYEEIIKRWSDSGRIVIVAGKGNNGGDGFVIARHLWNNGYDVSVYIIGQDITGDALTNLDGIRAMGLPIKPIANDNDIEALKRELASRKTTLCVDALLGTGLSQEVRPLHALAIRTINDSDLPVVAVDIPSGLNSDSGHAMGIAVRADITVSFAYPKVGLVLSSQYVGELLVPDISIPKCVERDDWNIELLDEQIFETIPNRAPESHKGDFGRLALVAGSDGLTGAATLASLAAARSGAGLVTLAVPEGINAIMETKLTEVMTRPLGQSMIFEPEMLEPARKLVTECDAVVIGPGIGTAAPTAAFICDLIRDINRPMVIDADALNIIAGQDICAHLPAIMTPHPGEMARLLNLPTPAVQADRIEAARSCARRYNMVTILKGYRTIIASPNGDVAINPTGSNALASGGMGDVLAGIAGTMLANSMPAFEAACVATYLHGLASDRLNMKRGQLASDLIDEIPTILKEYNCFGTYQ